jgi:hypothetical protein
MNLKKLNIEIHAKNELMSIVFHFSLTTVSSANDGSDDGIGLITDGYSPNGCNIRPEWQGAKEEMAGTTSSLPLGVSGRIPELGDRKAHHLADASSSCRRVD